MLNSTEHEIFSANKYENAKNFQEKQIGQNIFIPFKKGCTLKGNNLLLRGASAFFRVDPFSGE